MNGQLINASNTLNSAVASVFSSINAVSNSSAMQGKGATAIKKYLVEVHQTCICQPLVEVLDRLQRGFKTYYSQYIAIDPAKDAIINTDELQTIKEVLTSALSQFEMAETEMRSAMKKIEDVSGQKYSGLGEFIPAKITKMCSQLSDLTEEIAAIETKSCSNVQSIQGAVDSISRVIYQYCTGKVDISKYSTQTFVSSDAYASLCASMSALAVFNNQLDEQAEQVDSLIAAVNQQWSERQETATNVKQGLAVFDKVATSIAGKLLPPEGAAVVASITGGVSSSISKTMDLWANGGFATMSTKDIVCDIMWDTSMGTLKGGTKGYIGAVTAKLQSAESVLSRFGLNLGTGFVNEMIDVPFEFIDSIYEGKGEVSFEDKWEEITSDEFALELVGKCTVDSILDSTIGHWGDEWGDSISKRAATEVAKGTFETVWNTGSDVLSQRIGDASDEFIETLFSGQNELQINVGEAVSVGCQELLDFSDLGEQVIGSFIDNGSAEVYEHSSLFDKPVVYIHEKAVDAKLRSDPVFNNANGPLYTHYELTMGGPEFSNNATNPDMVFVMDHSNPTAHYMREIYREQGERVEKGVGSIVKGLAKGIKVLVTGEEENRQPTLQTKPEGCLDSILALQNAIDK